MAERESDYERRVREGRDAAYPLVGQIREVLREAREAERDGKGEKGRG